MPNYVLHAIVAYGSGEALEDFTGSMFRKTNDGSIGFDFEGLIPMPPQLHVTDGGSVDMWMSWFAGKPPPTWMREREYPQRDLDAMNAGFSREDMVPVAMRLRECFADVLASDKRSTYLDLVRDILARLESGTPIPPDPATMLDRRAAMCIGGCNDALEALRSLANMDMYGHKSWYDWSLANWGTKWNACSFNMISQTDRCVEFSFETAWSCPEPVLRRLTEQFPAISFYGAALDEGWNFAARFGTYGKAFYIEYTTDRAGCIRARRYMDKGLPYRRCKNPPKTFLVRAGIIEPGQDGA